MTKSGTNEFHGDLFEFLRNGDLNARDYFSATRDSIKRNQWGGVIGGRIIKDKLFFFGGYQRTSLRSDPADQTSYVPTAAMLQGNFTNYAQARLGGRLPDQAVQPELTATRRAPRYFPTTLFHNRCSARWH